VIAERFSCGRISVCRVASSLGIYEYGGDRIRFVFRRNLKGYPILRSSNFEVLNVDSKEVLLTGRGYGHGVGMCQMGAIGRARTGQSFGEILDAYYTGSYIAAVNVKKSRGKIAYE
jgi:stage II sporulation protein D